jgi:ABC-type transport system substrate-binding protein
MAKFMLALLLICLATTVAPPLSLSSSTQRGSQIDALRMKVVRSPAAQLLDVTLGPPLGSDIGPRITSRSYLDGMYQQGKTVTSAPLFQACFMGFNYRRPPLDDVNFRHALAHLVPKARIAALYAPFVVSIDSVVPPALALWYNAEVDPHPYSLEEAEAILGHPSSNYVKLGGVWRYKDGRSLEKLRFYTPLEVTSPSAFMAARMFVEEAQKIGLTNIEHVPMDYAALLDLVYNGLDFEIFWTCYATGKDPTYLYDLFRTHYRPGEVHPCTVFGMWYPELDQLLDIIYFGLDYSAIVAAAMRVQEILMGGSVSDPLPLSVSLDDRREALPVIPVYTRLAYDSQHPDLRGAVNMPGYGIDNLWTYLNMHWATPDGYRPGTAERTIVEILEDYPERLNPIGALSPYSWGFMNHVFDKLIAASPYTGVDEPWLATSWSYNVVPAGMDITFNLRITDSSGEPIKWQDGKPITAEDVKFTWDFFHAWNFPIREYHPLEYYDPTNTVVADVDTIIVRMTVPSQWYVYKLAEFAYRLPPQVYYQDPRTGAPWDSLSTILGFDPSAYSYPLPGNYNPGPIALPTQLFGTGPFINMHSTTTIWTQNFGDLQANPSYWLFTNQITGMLSEMFHRAGDVDYSGKVDTLDLATIGLALMTSQGDPLWNPAADVTSANPDKRPDGHVDIFDLSTAGRFYGQTKTAPYEP